MKSKCRILLVMCLVLVTNTVIAKPNIVLENFWVVSAPAVASYTAAYGTIKNTGNEEDTLLKVTNENGNVMMHNSVINNGKATMLHVKTLAIKAQQKIVFKPMSYHLMFANPNKATETPPKALKFVFHFKKSGNIGVLVPIKSPW